MADDDEWKFSVEEVGPDDPEETEDATDEDGEDDPGSVTVVGEDDDGPTVGFAAGEEDAGEDGSGDGGNVAGALGPGTDVEPGTPELENVAFAAAGAVLTALVFAGVLGGLDPVTAAAIAAAVVGGSGLLYVLFRRF